MERQIRLGDHRKVVASYNEEGTWIHVQNTGKSAIVLTPATVQAIKELSDPPSGRPDPDRLLHIVDLMERGDNVRIEKELKELGYHREELQDPLKPGYYRYVSCGLLVLRAFDGGVIVLNLDGIYPKTRVVEVL